MRNLFLILLVFCFQIYFAQQEIARRENSLPVNNVLQHSKLLFRDGFSPREYTSDEQKNKELLIKNIYNFNTSLPGISTHVPQSVYNPSGTINKNNAIFNGIIKEFTHFTRK